jgi:osmotically-inducible protein OsmY
MIASAVDYGSHEVFELDDGQIRAAVTAALGSAQYTALRSLKCLVSDGVAEITGTVPSFYLKQLAQAAVLQLPGVRIVRNLVEVCR